MIEWKDISFSYTGNRTGQEEPAGDSRKESGGLQDIHFSVKKGECVLFCGRSGCGKTTMLRLINGLIPSFFPGDGKGAAYLDGQDISELPMYRLAERVGSVFQNPRTQFFNVDTDSEIAFGIENAALPVEELRRRVDQTSAKLHVENLRGRSIFALSGGEKQKIAFASVYAMNPDIYVLDEPSSNLDEGAIGELREHLRLVKEQGKTILIAEHRLYYLMDLADRVVYLENGRIRGVYTPKELMAFSGEKRKNMGLRAFEFKKILPEKEKDAAKEGRISVLELKDVTLRYGKRRVLEHISLSAARGEIIAVVAPNGTGKTTFARALCGLHKDCDGQFLWEGKTLDRRARRKKSYLVMQDVGYELFAESVEKECIFGIRNPDRRLAERTLVSLGLYEVKKEHPNTLSGGQKQRLAVAVSMVCGKDILVFDEPTSGLDYDSMIQVASLMRQLAEQGGIVFVVTHDYEFIHSACTRVICLEQGSTR